MEYTHWNKISKKSMILKGTTPMKTETEYTYTINGNLLTKKESGGALSWKYTHDENDNVLNANFGVGNITNIYDKR